MRKRKCKFFWSKLTVDEHFLNAKHWATASQDLSILGNSSQCQILLFCDKNKGTYNPTSHVDNSLKGLFSFSDAAQAVQSNKWTTFHKSYYTNSAKNYCNTETLKFKKTYCTDAFNFYVQILEYNQLAQNEYFSDDKRC